MFYAHALLSIFQSGDGGGAVIAVTLIAVL